VSSRRSHLTLIVLILAALVGVFLIGWSGSPFHKPIRKGLDLQGGLEVVLKAQPPKGHQLTSSDLDRSVSIMRNRVDKLGVSEPHIQKQGSNEIVIQLAGVHDPAAAAKLIGSTAKLELYDLEPALVPPSGAPIASLAAAAGRTRHQRRGPRSRRELQRRGQHWSSSLNPPWEELSR